MSLPFLLTINYRYILSDGCRLMSPFLLANINYVYIPSEVLLTGEYLFVHQEMDASNLVKGFHS